MECGKFIMIDVKTDLLMIPNLLNRSFWFTTLFWNFYSKVLKVDNTFIDRYKKV